MLRLVSDVFPMLMLCSWRTLCSYLQCWVVGFRYLQWRLIDVIYVAKFIALVQLVVHVCWLCSLCHIVYRKRFLFVVICCDRLLFILSTLHWFYFWCLFGCFVSIPTSHWF